MQELFDKLCTPFPRENVHWRAKTLTNDGSKAMALAYIDARDVMDRLDAVCGPDGWQCEHYGVGGKTACKVGIRSPLVSQDGQGVWIWKSDGAGDTAVEADKGAMSDAFKRAAVHWGIGRYLYDLPAPWVPCETYERNGKKIFKRFTADPWGFCKVPLVQDNKPEAAVFTWAGKSLTLNPTPPKDSRGADWKGPMNKGQLRDYVQDTCAEIRDATNSDDLIILGQSPEFWDWAVQAANDFPDMLVSTQQEQCLPDYLKARIKELKEQERAHPGVRAAE